MKKNLLSICIFILAVITISCSRESYITKDVFAVGEGAEVSVSILYESGYFEISVTISNTTEKTIVLYNDFFRRGSFIGSFENSYGENGAYTQETVLFDDGLYPTSFISLEPDESINHSAQYEYYINDSQEKIISNTKGKSIFNKEDQIYYTVRYFPYDGDLKDINTAKLNLSFSFLADDFINTDNDNTDNDNTDNDNTEFKSLANEYFLEAFEKKYVLTLPKIDTEEKFSEGGFEYTVKNGKATITDYIGSDENLNIPEKLGEYEVINIGYSAFREYKSLKTVKIPNSIISIGKSAFENCSSLTAIEISNSVTSIGAAAFRNCNSLITIKIPDFVSSIEQRTFSGCTSLKEVEIPNSVTSIGYETFKNCTSLTSIKIPNSVTEIASWLFSGCTNLKNVEIPNSITSIGVNAFENCSSLTAIKIPDFVKNIKRWTFSGCASLKEVEIPNSVTNIGYGSFENCMNLTSIKISNSLMNIEANAFKGSNKVTLIIPKGSFSHEYAIENNIDYVLE